MKLTPFSLPSFKYLFSVSPIIIFSAACLIGSSCRAKMERPVLDVPDRYAYTHVLIHTGSETIPAIRTLTVRDGEKWRIELADMTASRSRIFLSTDLGSIEDEARSGLYDVARSIEHAFAATRDPEYTSYLGKTNINGRFCHVFKSSDDALVIFSANDYTLVRREADNWQENYVKLELTPEQWVAAFVDTNSWLKIMGVVVEGSE